MICGVAIIGSGQALAQDSGDEIVVTGSRIPTQNLTSTSPLTVVSSQEARLQGTTSVETLLQNLPSVVPEFNQGVDNGATGTATVSLRGLGSNRTLVLVDGDRLMPGDPIVPSPDLNNIPAALVDHIEVVTGGASAVYGSDAVAGVVNFIMLKNFEGVRLDAQYGFALHHNGNEADRTLVSNYNATHQGNEIALATDGLDAESFNVTAVIGVNSADGKGNITAYAGYRNLQPLGQGRRDYGACGLSTISSVSNVYDTHVCQGSSNSAYGRFVDFGSSDNPDGSKTFVPFSGAYAFNFGPYNYYQQHDELYTAGYFAHYEVTPSLDVYSRLMFADDDQFSQAAPSGLFFNNGPIYAISCSNPLMSAAQAAVVCGPGAPDVHDGISDHLTIAYRFQGVPRVTDLSHTAYTVTLGAKGQIGTNWSWDLHGQFGRTAFREVFKGDVSNTKINEALNAIPGPGGTAVCASGNPSCVPLDIFTSLARDLTPEMLNFLEVTAFKTGYTTELIVDASITGDLGARSPWASDSVKVAAGAEYRRENLKLDVDSEFATADLSGSGGVNPPGSGAFNVYELFGELRAPLIQDMPMVNSLALELGYRYSDYSLSGNTSTYKALLDWAPTPDIRLRGGYNRAVRAPNIVELFTPPVVALESFGDPCSGATPGASLAQCELTGVTAAQYGHVPDCGAAQCSGLQGGNTALKPEKADTYTVGAVITPRFLRGFSATIDWYSIRINQPIQPLGGSLIVSQCIAGVQSFCDLIHRAPGSGALFGLTTADGYVIDLNANTGHVLTTGLDLGVSYRLDLSRVSGSNLGTLSFNFLGSYVDKFETAPNSTAATYDCAGLYGLVCLEPTPKWKHQFRVTWASPWNLDLSVNWRYLGPVNLDINTSDPQLAVYGVGFQDSIDAKLPSYSYFDLAAQWRVKDHFTFRAGVNNLFDKDPPVVDANYLGVAGTNAFGNGNTFPGVYDTLGRTVFVGLTADF